MPEPVVYRGMALIVPETDSEWHGYFQAAREGRLVVRRCADCRRLRYPPGAGCPWCASLAWTWATVSGRGTIHSYVIVVQAIQPGFRDWAPYPVVVVELDEQRGEPTPDDGVRLVTNLVTRDFEPEREERSRSARASRSASSHSAPEGALPQFRLAGEPPTAPLWRLPT